MSFTTATTPITPVVLCGGTGTRLWPLSRKSFPKQFVPRNGYKCLLPHRMQRVSVQFRPSAQTACCQ